MRRPRYLLVLIFVAGVALLYQGLQWFDDYLDRSSRGEPAVVPEAVEPSAPSLPKPTERELEDLLSLDRETQLSAARILSRRELTEEAQGVIERALFDATDEAVEARLACLKARFPGRDSLDFAVGRLESLIETQAERVVLAWSIDPNILCHIQAVSERAEEDPGRTREVLLRLAFSTNGMVRRLANHGLAKLEVETLPEEVTRRLGSTYDIDRLKAVECALALNVLAFDVSLVEDWLKDYDDRIRFAVKRHLAGAAGREAPRFIARALVADQDNRELLGLFEEREKRSHDVSPALVEIALDEAAPEASRVAALEIVGASGDPEVAERIAPLASLPVSPVATYAEAAVRELQYRRERRGEPHRKALQP